jgi:hypothetical protein
MVQENTHKASESVWSKLIQTESQLAQTEKQLQEERTSGQTSLEECTQRWKKEEERLQKELAAAVEAVVDQVCTRNLCVYMYVCMCYTLSAGKMRKKGFRRSYLLLWKLWWTRYVPQICLCVCV